MKKLTSLLTLSALALTAAAQYSVNPSTSVAVENKPTSLYYIGLSDAGVAEFEKAGAKINYIGPDPENGRNLWLWENTFVAFDASYPCVDEEEGGYVAVEVAQGTTWSGAGYAVDNGIDLSSFNDDTHFHIAYMTPNDNPPASIVFILLNCAETNSQPAKFAVGAAGEDAGVAVPAIAPAASDDWQGLDITFADLKKIWPGFSPASMDSWTGNLLSFLGGAVGGTTLALDAIYFYNVGEEGDDSAVETVNNEAAFVVTGNTVNALGANGIALYDMNGRLLKQTAGSTLGLTDLSNGVYVVRSGKNVKKVVVK